MNDASKILETDGHKPVIEKNSGQESVSEKNNSGRQFFTDERIVTFLFVMGWVALLSTFIALLIGYIITLP